MKEKKKSKERFFRSLREFQEEYFPKDAERVNAKEEDIGRIYGKRIAREVLELVSQGSTQH